MEPRLRRSLIASLVPLALAAPAAAAPTKAECIAASQSAQELAVDRHFVKAREGFLLCSRDECPKAVRADCTEQFAKAEQSIATIVVSARRADGSAIAATSASIDGEASVTLDGSALRVDPGKHRITVEAPGQPPAAVDVTIQEGARLQPVVATFGPAPASSAAPSAASTAAPSAAPSASSPQAWYPAAPIAAGALGLAALATFGGMGAVALDQSSKLRALPPHTYAQSDVDALRTKAAIADVALGVGVAAAATAVVLFLVHARSKPAAPASATLHVLLEAPCAFTF